MIKKDRILSSFLEHHLIKEKYKVANDQIPETVIEALRSEHIIIKAIALFIEGLDGSSSGKSETALRKQIIQYLNETLS